MSYQLIEISLIYFKHKTTIDINIEYLYIDYITYPAITFCYHFNTNYGTKIEGKIKFEEFDKRNHSINDIHFSHFFELYFRKLIKCNIYYRTDKNENQLKDCYNISKKYFSIHFRQNKEKHLCLTNMFTGYFRQQINNMFIMNTIRFL